MPIKAKKPCKHTGCVNLTSDKYCAEHVEEHKNEADNYYNKFQRDKNTYKRYGADWRKIRKIYITAHPLCEECGKRGLITPAEEVHHIVPLTDGGTHNYNNLMSLCKRCHSSITLKATMQGGRG